MLHFNKVQLGGNLTRDPEVKFTPKGTAIVDFGVATNRSWKNDSGEKQEEVTFVDVTIWGATGEAFAEYHKKGDSCFLECRLKLDTWEDKATGQKRSKLKLICESWHFNKPPRADSGSGSNQSRSNQPQKQRPSPPPRKSHDMDLDSGDGDDIPF